MFIIKNKLRILSAVILAISSAATVLSACGGDEIPEIPAETVIGTHGEILGVSVYTQENESETYTMLYEITTKKNKNKDKKTEADNSAVATENTRVITNKSDSAETSAQSSRKMTVRNNSSGITLKPQQSTEKTSRVRVTFPPETTQKSTRVAPTFGDGGEGKTKHVPVSYVPPVEKETKKPAQATTVKQTQAKITTERNVVSDEKVPEKSEGINIVFKTESVEKGNTASVMIQGTPGKKYSIDFYVNPSDVADYSALADQTADENGFVTWTFNVPMNCESGNRKVVIKESGSGNYAQTSIEVK